MSENKKFDKDLWDKMDIVGRLFSGLVLVAITMLRRNYQLVAAIRAGSGGSDHSVAHPTAALPAIRSPEKPRTV